MLDNHLQDALEATLQAIGKQTRNHFNALLRRRQLCLNSRTRRRLQSVSIQSLRSTGDACALRLDFVQISHHAKRRLPNERCREWDYCASVASPDNCSGFVIHHVVHIYLTLNHDGAWVNRLGQAIQRVAHDRRLDALQIHRQISDRLPEYRMRGRVRRKNGKRSLLNHLAMQDVGAITNTAHLM